VLRLPSLRNGGSSGCVDALSARVAKEGSYEGPSLPFLQMMIPRRNTTPFMQPTAPFWIVKSFMGCS